MANPCQASICISSGPHPSATWHLLLGIWLIFLPGCGGCSKAPTAEEAAADKAAADKARAEKEKEKEKAKAKPKADFDPLRFTMVPGDPAEPLRMIKPDHWTAATLQARANNFDFQGELTVRGTNRLGQPLLVEGTPFYVALERSASLPKGQQKHLEVTLFAPRTRTRPWFQSQLRDSANRLDARREQEQVQPMAAYEYGLVVLAQQPERYKFLRLLESVRPADLPPPESDGYFYQVIATPVGNRARLPSQSLLWTSIAALIWDGVLPQTLDKEQQVALVDWLHWGGNLIVSGPKSLDHLRGSFLEAYLPVHSDGGRAISGDDLAGIAASYHVTTARPENDRLQAVRPWPGVQWHLQGGGEFVPTAGELIAERPVGRGRVVVTAFSLAQPELVRWRGFDGLFNACLLRRAPRHFSAGADGFRRTTWAGDPVPSVDEPFRVGATSAADDKFWNAQRVTAVRYFTRDAGTPQSAPPDVPPDEDDPPTLVNGVGSLLAAATRPHEGGAAAWNDWGAVSEAVRKSLRAGAGINVPKPSFVLWVLALYLTVLVPVNWSVFRLLGRVEWAWAMTPVISLAFAAVVIWLAQLDIGFVRSATELRIVELHGGYPRAHLARYTALYASLSSSYDLHYAAPSALARPFPATPDFALLHGQTRREVQFRHEGGLLLSNVDVASNSTVMVHAEAMWDLGGSVLWHEPQAGPPELSNHTALRLEGVRVLRRRLEPGDASNLEVAWVGTLPPGMVVQPRFGGSEKMPPDLGTRPASGPADGQSLDLAGLVRIAEEGSALAPGAVRLVGWCMEEVPGLEIRPATTRRRQATLVVAHLAPGHRPDPSPDVWSTVDTGRPGELVPAGQEPAPVEKSE